MKSIVVKASSDERPNAVHGGRVYEAARRWGVSPHDVIDFSSNINPLGAPAGVRAAIANSIDEVALRAYPDSHEFICDLAGRHGIAPDSIVAGSGTAALMFAVLRALLPARVLILEPAFSEYARACAMVKAEVTSWTLSMEDDFTPDFDRIRLALEERRFDLVIINSPHNPTGMLYERDELLKLAEAAQKSGATLLVDEAFIDYAAPQSSLLWSATEAVGLVVLRSLTKFYAMPGLRVGYAVCGRDLAHRVKEQIEAWPVSTVALEAARASLREVEFNETSRHVNAQAREEFASELRRIGLQVFPSSANFLLVRLPRRSGLELSDWLEQHRTLIRRCDSFEGLGDDFIRLAVRRREDNLRLASLIETWLAHSFALKVDN